MKPTALMTQYAEGQLVSRDLQNMMVDYAAQARFDRDMHDDVDLYVDQQCADDALKFSGDRHETDTPKET